MKLDILSKGKEKKGSLEMPPQFSEDIREDIIKRAVEAEQALERQPYGASPEAGMRHSTFVSKRRHDYKATYGIGQSRTPRKITSRSGARMNFVGAFAPMTVGGRRAHPPKADKIWKKKINKKEWNLAMRSAISATLAKENSLNRGYIVPDGYPFLIDDSVTKINKTKDAIDLLKEFGFDAELKRAEAKKIRAGRGKSRGRKYKKKTSLLIVTEKECALSKSGKNIPGVNIVSVDEIKIQGLAPGGVPGRITLWTTGAIQKISKEKMFE